jgi:hypothetical protein
MIRHSKYILLLNNNLFVFGNGQNLGHKGVWRDVLCLWNEGFECFFFDQQGDDIEHIDDLMRMMLKGPIDLYTQEAVRNGGVSVRLEFKEIVE